MVSSLLVADIAFNLSKIASPPLQLVRRHGVIPRVKTRAVSCNPAEYRYRQSPGGALVWSGFGLAG